MQALEDMLEDLFRGLEVEQWIASITFGVLKNNLNAAMIDKFVEALHSLDEFVIEGSGCSERGDKAFRTHMQSMLLLQIKTSAESAAQLKEYLLTHMGLRDEGNEFAGTVRSSGHVGWHIV
jgi:hypothetical protein